MNDAAEMPDSGGEAPGGGVVMTVGSYSQPGRNSALGRLLCRRWSWHACVGRGAVFAAVAAPFLAAMWEAFGGWASGRGDLQLALALGGIALLPLGASILSFAAALTRVMFFEHGAVRNSLYGNVVIAYEDVATIEYKRVRRFANAGYAGTQVEIALRTHDGRRIRWRGRHKEKRKGFLRVRFEGRDELDDINSFLSERIADRMLDAIVSGESVAWTESAELSEQGLRVMRGRGKGEPIPYDQLDRIDADRGMFCVYRSGELQPVLVVASDEPNFWPGLALLGRLAGAMARPDRELLAA